ncbi:S8 family serine peptidase [uncultured Tateyamaria sp.]|uniref:S8 family serine peptidase n=1 Tax=uncultured Tateyamaria sp. TaxID=455651 RepID=UPI00261E6FCC|nr:S8 family serine peptidase [uncultured Tateyamaria sp.]
MSRFIAFFALVGLIELALPRSAASQDWQLTDANTLAPTNYLILTIPQDEPQTLAALADTLAADFGVSLAAEWPLNALEVHCFVFDARNVSDVDGLITAMETDARIRTVQRLRSFSLTEMFHSDPLLPLQWALQSMRVLPIHASSLGEGVRVGIVDSAIDNHHPDLADQMVDLFDFVAADPVPLAEAHGTAVAGIIGAAATNEGIVGVAPSADMVGLRACWQQDGAPGVCNSFSLARAINFAILNDIDVLNLSIGGPEDPLLTELINVALEAGIVVVAASGEGQELVYPASLDGVIAAGQVAGRSVPAPMVDVLTTAPGSAHRYVSGSSIATAHVSGVVALMLSQDPTLTSAAISERLNGSISDVETLPMLNACTAILGPSEACAL